MKGLRLASEPRVWAHSRHHGPTNYDGPNPRPRVRAHIKRLLFVGGSRHAAKFYAFLTLILLAAGFLAGAVPEGDLVYRWVIWALIPIVALGNPHTRREVLGILGGFGVLVFLLWFFLGRSF